MKLNWDFQGGKSRPKDFQNERHGYFLGVNNITKYLVILEKLHIN